VDEFAAVFVRIFAIADLAGVDFGDVVYCGSDRDCAEGLKCDGMRVIQHRGRKEHRGTQVRREDVRQEEKMRALWGGGIFGQDAG
jgi:hypothetical protein